MIEVYEQRNRRAEITGSAVAFLRMSGNVRRSTQQVWWVETKSLRTARNLAKAWAFQAVLPSGKGQGLAVTPSSAARRWLLA